MQTNFAEIAVGWAIAHTLPVSQAKWRTSGTKATPSDGATLAILAESNRYAADMTVSALLQAKASSFHLLPALCAYALPAGVAYLRHTTLRQRHWHSKSHSADHKLEPHAQLAVDASPRQSAA